MEDGNGGTEKRTVLQTKVVMPNNQTTLIMKTVNRAIM